MGNVSAKDGVRLYYDEFGTGDRMILSAQAGFYPAGMQQALADRGYHVYCMTLRGFAPSDYVTEDYGDAWYDVFADDVIALADMLGIGRFFYMGASHGAGVGWHLVLRHPERVSAFVAVVPGPHSLAEGAMSYRQMLMQGLISEPPPFDPPIDNDPDREVRRAKRQEWLNGLPEADPREKRIDYGRPLMRFGTEGQLWLNSLPEADPREKSIDYGRPLMQCGSEEKLRELLSSFRTPVLILGGTEDPISTPELMMRTARCLPHCKMVMYSNCGHNIDTDLVEELTEETDRFLKQATDNGKWYAFPKRLR